MCRDGSVCQVALVGLLVLSGAVNASVTSIYVDFDVSPGGPGVPPSTYAAAAPSAGAWNAIPATDGVYGSIIDTNGAALAGVTIDLGGNMQIQGTVNAPMSLGPHQALLGDYFDTSLPAPPAWVLQFLGIPNGTYDVYVYAPSDPNLPTSAWSFTNGTPQPNISGSVDNVLNLGVDYVIAQTTVTSNSLVINSGSIGGGLAGPSGLAGIQLIQTAVVPIPAAAWLFGSGLSLLGWLRRNPYDSYRGSGRCQRTFT